MVYETVVQGVGNISSAINPFIVLLCTEIMKVLGIISNCIFSLLILNF